jgi:hypothetical protein
LKVERFVLRISTLAIRFFGSFNFNQLIMDKFEKSNSSSSSYSEFEKSPVGRSVFPNLSNQSEGSKSRGRPRIPEQWTRVIEVKSTN